MERPYIICHMVMSIDGKVTGSFLGYQDDAVDNIYFEKHRQFNADAFACGRVTMIGSFTQGFKPDLTAFKDVEIEEGDYVAGRYDHYAVAFDRHGKLGWQDDCLHDEDPGYDGHHIIEVTTKQASSAYLAYLRSIGVSYLICGDVDLDMTMALHKLKTLFSINTLLLEGGSVINGAFARENMIDELSLVVSPTMAEKGSGSLCHHGRLTGYTLKSYEVFGDVIYLQYQRKN